jgi:hypothetical protein
MRPRKVLAGRSSIPLQEKDRRTLSLKGDWLDGRVAQRGHRLAFEPESHFVGGMSGSPIVSLDGHAIGVVSVDLLSPVLMDTLALWLVRSIISAQAVDGED